MDKEELIKIIKNLPGEALSYFHYSSKLDSQSIKYDIKKESD